MDGREARAVRDRFLHGRAKSSRPTIIHQHDDLGRVL